MRITGGKFGGRNLVVPKSDLIRPTQDRVREALFSILMPEMVGATFLDLFAGCGAVGLEALSRGANSVVFVERSRKHIDVITRNIEAVGVGACSRVIAADAYSFIESYMGSGFTIAFADPPYALGEERGYVSVLKTLAERGVVRPNGLFIAEMTAVQKVDEISGWEVLRDRTYGKTRLVIWRRDQQPREVCATHS